MRKRKEAGQRIVKGHTVECSCVRSLLNRRAAIFVVDGRTEEAPCWKRAQSVQEKREPATLQDVENGPK
uniref:Uncharacterized protein n=1 Tax=Sphaerodactylus townsendi TaxID=933632 RepID=A0ACB8F1G3_9SAUR